MLLTACLGAAAVTVHTGDHSFTGLLKCAQVEATGAATFNDIVIINKAVTVKGEINSPTTTALSKRIEDLVKTMNAIPKYEIAEMTFTGSRITGDAGSKSATERRVGTHSFSRGVKNVNVALAGVHTENRESQKVGIHRFWGRAEVDSSDPKKVTVFVGHHMSDWGEGAVDGNGSIRILVIGELE